MAAGKPDAILLTCTYYIAVLEGASLPVSTPVINILMKSAERRPLRTHPDTVKGTMDRLSRHATHRQASVDVEIAVIDDAFDLIMKGRARTYGGKFF